MQLIDEAVQQGARRARACEQVGISVRSVQRWREAPQDGRTLVQDGLKEGEHLVGDGSLFLQFKNSLQH